VIQLDNAKAIEQLSKMQSQINSKFFRSMIVFLDNRFKAACEGLYVDQVGINKLKSALSK